jgi:ATP-dependent protease ClpP protease subunit
MNEIYLIGEVGYEITLENTIQKVNQTDKSKPLKVNIHSQGGSVYEGLAIYNYLKQLPQEVNTNSSGLVASIASIIFLAGQKRVINRTDSFLIHLPMALSGGNAKDLEKTAKELRDIEDKLSTIYEDETDLTKKEALNLMKKDEFLNPDFLVQNGFVNEIIEFVAVAKLDNKYNMSEQLTKKDAENLFEKFGNKLKEYFNPEKPDNKIVQDANGVEIEFVNLSDSDKPQEGNEAFIENKKASGEYTMPNGEIWNFENGKLQSVKVKEESDVLVAKLENNLKIKNELLETKESELNELRSKLETEQTNFKQLESDFVNFKKDITSKFEFEEKTELKEENQSRTNFKSKYKN